MVVIEEDELILINNRIQMENNIIYECNNNIKKKIQNIMMNN